ncbi:MAG: hypothetical protein WDZ63_11060 [Burkholderiales bacterium]
MKTGRNGKWLAGSVMALSAVILATSAIAGEIRSRNVEDAQADLLRDWNAKDSGQKGSLVRSRSQEDAYADLMRDRGAKPAGEARVVGRRSEMAMYKDLMRDWSPGEEPSTAIAKVRVFSRQ